MTDRKVNIECWGRYGPPPYAVRVRNRDGLEYNPASDAFGGPCLIPTTAGEFSSVYTLSLTPAFLDGAYAVLFFDGPVCVGSENFVVVVGSVAPVTPTDIAARVAGIQVGKMTLRDALVKLSGG